MTGRFNVLTVKLKYDYSVKKVLTNTCSVVYNVKSWGTL